MAKPRTPRAYIEPRHRKDGTVGYRVKWRDPNSTERDKHGKIVPQSETFDDEQQALLLKRTLEACGLNTAEAYAALEAATSTSQTVTEMVTAHIDALSGVDPRTRKDYRGLAFKHITPHIGALPADTIGRDRIRGWVNKLADIGPAWVGAALRADRENAGLTQREVAEMVQRPVSWVSHYETGVARLTPVQLDAVCTALSLPAARCRARAKLAKGMSPKTLKNIHALLSAAFTWAIQEHELRATNPAKGVALPKYHRPEMTFLTPAEFAVLLSHFRQPCYRDPVHFLAATGIRWGELAALTVGDVHLDEPVPYVSINKAIKREDGGRGQYVGDPKSMRSRRLVSIAPDVVAMLRPLVDGRPETAVLFVGPKGARLTYTNFRDRHWVPAVLAATATRDAAGDPIPAAQRINKQKIHIHCLRHSHASWLIGHNLDMLTIQRRLGHESIKTTYDVYGHLDPRHLRAAADAMSEILGSLVNPPDLDPLAPVLDLDEARVQRGRDHDLVGAAAAADAADEPLFVDDEPGEERDAS